VTRRNEVLYAVPGLPQEYRNKVWGRAFVHPQEAVEALCAGLDSGARIAVVPEGPYVLAQVRA